MADVSHVFEFYNISEGEAYIEFLLYGLYALYTGGEINGGFHFAIPLPGKRWKRNHAFRIKPADYFAWTYSMVSHGKYINDQMGKSYNIRPDENRSSNFYQPDYIRHFLIKEQERKTK